MITSYKSLENRFSNYLLLPIDLYNSAWVNDVTELRGGNVDINVGGKTTVTGAIIAAGEGGDLNMDAKNDINIQGADIAAGGTGFIAAGNNINILEAQNTRHTSSSHEDTKINTTMTVGNAYVDAGYAAYDLVDAQVKLVEAAHNLDKVKDLYNNGKASGEAVRDASIALTMAYLNVANAETAALNAAVGAGTAASSSLGTGMYVSGGLNYETNKTTSSFDTKQSVASNLFGENMSFTSGNNMTQVGANVSATDTVSYNIGNDLNVLAGTDTYRTESGSQTITAGASIGNNAVQVNAGYSESSNRASGTTHNNSNITADNITVKTGGDATFAGANVTADDKLAMNIGGNLNVESKQDTDYAKGNNWGIGAGIGGGQGVSASLGGNYGHSEHDSAWVNDVTELRGGNVDINVDGKTTVTGAVIAANADGELNLTTNELEYNDIHDFNTNHNNGVGLNTGFGIGTNKGESTLHPEKTTDVTIVHKGHDTEQTTHATIGAGNITVGGDTNPELAGLNRDTDKVQEITKDEITGSLDSSVTVDNSQLVNNPLDTLKNPWNALNTTIGISNALINIGDYAIRGPYTTLEENVEKPHKLAVEIQDGTLHLSGGLLGSGAVSLGNVITYYKDWKPDSVINSIYSGDRIIVSEHEKTHVKQSSILGPAYLPVYFLNGGWWSGTNNWMEKQADEAGKKALMDKIKTTYGYQQ